MIRFAHVDQRHLGEAADEQHQLGAVQQLDVNEVASSQVASCIYQRLLPDSFLKATNKEVSAHIQLWDPSDIQSGLDAKDL